MGRIARTALFALALSAGPALAKDTLFWNLTADKIVKFQLSPPGKDQWGANQTANDKDGSVDPDERLKITGVAAGDYDVMFTDAKGRTCVVRKVAIETGKIFSIDEKELANGCKP